MADLLKRTQELLACSSLRLYKIASNSPAVMKAFLWKDHVKDLKHLDLEKDTPPVQQNLGLSWNLKLYFTVFMWKSRLSQVEVF